MLYPYTHLCAFDFSSPSYTFANSVELSVCLDIRVNSSNYVLYKFRTDRTHSFTGINQCDGSTFKIPNWET